jgi:RNA polymerase sigma-70 factor (ECF subfamily)
VKRKQVSYLPGPAGERALVARLAAGEETAYRETYELLAPGVMTLLVRVLKNRALAEEVLQDTFIAAFRGIGSFRGETRLFTWVAGIGVRRALNALRDEARRSRGAPPPLEISHTPEPWLGHRDDVRKVLELLETMEPPKRLALLLQAEGHTAAEIAGMTGEPRGTILSRLSRGKAELAALAAEAGLSPLPELDHELDQEGSS